MKSLLKLSLCLSPLLLLLAGCGSAMRDVSPVGPSSPLSGVVFGGQNPITGATISVYAADSGCEPTSPSCSGTYGSTATLLVSTTTDGSGKFNFVNGTIVCPQANTPLYILSLGGNTGGGINEYAVLGTGLGACGSIGGKVQINEVTTAALAYSLAQFYTTTLGGNPSTDAGFGGPVSIYSGTVTYSQGLTRANTYTAPLLAAISTGLVPSQPVVNGTTTSTVEAAKIYTIANVLAACVNSAEATGPPVAPSTACTSLFTGTTPPGGSTPSSTLQAAVQMALYPGQNVPALFNLIGSQQAFGGGLATAPNDWTIGVSYATPNMGLAVLPQTLSTLDIDKNGKIAFPSNAAGQVGLGLFDPTVGTFSGPFASSAGLVHPQQVAIDTPDYAWLTDNSSPTVAGFDTGNGANSYNLSLGTGTSSTALSIGDDNRINVGVTDTNNSTYDIANISSDRTTYAIQSGTSLGAPVVSIAADAVGGEAITLLTGSPHFQGDQQAALPPNGSGTLTTSIVSGGDDSGQVLFTCPAGGCVTETDGNYVALRSYYSGGENDGLCIYSSGKCARFAPIAKNSPQGMVLDGEGNLWIAEAGDSGVAEAPFSGAYTTATNPPLNIYVHGSGNGGTMTTPYGIGVDVSGNVWVSNAGCVGTTGTPNCTPGGFTLSELVGAAAPTMTPTAQQIIYNTTYTGTRPNY